MKKLDLKQLKKSFKKRFLNRKFMSKVLVLITTLALVAGYILPYLTL